MLAWPALKLLASSGACEVSVLVPEYTAELARLCPSVRRIVLDPGAEATQEQQQTLLRQLRTNQYDAAIALFSNWRNASILRQANIPYRLAPATKFAQILYTDRLTQRRSRSLKPEWEYNLDLAQHYLMREGLPIHPVSAPYLVVKEERRLQARAQIARSAGLDFARPWLVVHPGSGGSAVNLSTQQYIDLIRLIAKSLPNYQVLLSAGPSELETVNRMVFTLSDDSSTAHPVQVGVMLPEHGLKGLVAALDNADVMMAGSTGPLHIAGALDRPTVGFFPAKRSATALRWQTLNSPGRHLAIQAPADQGEASFAELNLVAVAQQIIEHIRQTQYASRVFASQS